ncbi:MAG: preprotein translocase subunit SecG [Chlamydiota bacterium]
MTVLFYLVIFFFLLLCSLLCFVVLIQESKSLGLGASFGGNTGDSLFGTSTADVLKKFTGYLALIFVVVCIVLSLWSSRISRGKVVAPQVTIEQETTT